MARQRGLRQLPLQRPSTAASTGPQRRGHGRGLRRLRPGELVPGHPERRRPGDHPLVPPAGDHPVRPDRTRDQRLERPPITSNRGATWADSAARILRPVAADGHDAATFPDLVPDPTTGKITYDVDNDGDGVTDSVWVDLGYPARRDAQRPALQAAVRLHGHRPERPDPAQHGRQPRPGADGDLGDATPRTWATRSARSTRPTRCRTRSTRPPTTPVAFNVAGTRRRLAVHASTPRWTTPAIDVRLTQLRNLLAGTRPQPNPTTSGSATRRRPDGDDQRRRQLRPRHCRHGGGQPYFMPNGIAGLRSTLPIGTDAGNPRGPAPDPAGAGPLGRGPVDPRRSPIPSPPAASS